MRILVAGATGFVGRACMVLAVFLPLPIVLVIALINLSWLLPIACWVVLGGEGLVGILLAYVLLVGLALRFKAGVAD